MSRSDEPLHLTYPEEDHFAGKDEHFSTRGALRIFQNLLQPPASLTVNQAATLISDMLPEKNELEDRADETSHLGSVVLTVAEQIPYYHPSQNKLVQLLRRLSTATKLNYSVPDKDFWLNENLSDFRADLYGLDKADYESQTEVAIYLNNSSFLAHLTSSGFVTTISYGIKTMKQALEAPYLDNLEAWNQQCRLSAAAIWMIICGQTMYTQLVESPPNGLSDNRGVEPETNALFNGETFGIERWRFWRDQLEKRAEQGLEETEKGWNEEWRRLVRNAADVMEAVERSRQW